MSKPNSNPAVSAAAVTSGDQEGRRLTWDTQMDLMMLRLVRSMPNCLRKSRTNEEAALLLSQSDERFAGLKKKGLVPVVDRLHLLLKKHSSGEAASLRKSGSDEDYYFCISRGFPRHPRYPLATPKFVANILLNKNSANFGRLFRTAA